MSFLDSIRQNNHHIAAPGRFIVIDGPDGTGKATQTELLAQTLAEAGYDGVIFDFPQYNTASAAPLEKYLKGDYGQMNPHAASMLYAIDRFDASFQIRKYLEEGKVVLANRYVTSNAGHQGAKISDYDQRIKFYKWLDNLEHQTFGIPKPHLNIILHMPAEVSYDLIRKRAKADGRKLDIHEADPEHLMAAEKVYQEIAQLFPNAKLVECVEEDELLNPKRINGKIWDLVRRIALKDMQPHRVV